MIGMALREVSLKQPILWTVKKSKEMNCMEKVVCMAKVHLSKLDNITVSK